MVDLLRNGRRRCRPSLGPDAILWSIANVVTWTYTGYNMLIIYAALQAMPSDIGEAARVDGASAWTIALRHQDPDHPAGPGASPASSPSSVSS